MVLIEVAPAFTRRQNFVLAGRVTTMRSVTGSARICSAAEELFLTVTTDSLHSVQNGVDSRPRACFPHHVGVVANLTTKGRVNLGR